jgi:hypothetical protein
MCNAHRGTGLRRQGPIMADALPRRPASRMSQGHRWVVRESGVHHHSQVHNIVTKKWTNSDHAAPGAAFPQRDNHQRVAGFDSDVLAGASLCFPLLLVVFLLQALVEQ